MNRVARTAFWTLCVCACTLAVWCSVALLTGIQLLPFDDAGYIVFAGWTKDALFTYSLCVIVGVALLPFVFFFWRSLRIVLWDLEIWCFHFLLDYLPVY